MKQLDPKVIARIYSPTPTDTDQREYAKLFASPQGLNTLFPNLGKLAPKKRQTLGDKGVAELDDDRKPLDDDETCLERTMAHIKRMKK